MPGRWVVSHVVSPVVLIPLGGGVAAPLLLLLQRHMPHLLVPRAASEIAVSRRLFQVDCSNHQPDERNDSSDDARQEVRVVIPHRPRLEHPREVVHRLGEKASDGGAEDGADAPAERGAPESRCLVGLVGDEADVRLHNPDVSIEQPSEKANSEDLCEACREADADRVDDRHCYTEDQHWTDAHLVRDPTPREGREELPEHERRRHPPGVEADFRLLDAERADHEGQEGEHEHVPG
mmetsp:Transcript_9700/g.23722  ORF Transcript_9700/g.23722 Transcript_9700/m.23722 type:complete len:236 (-) Transcript_9700:406-1113(-)